MKFLYYRWLTMSNQVSDMNTDSVDWLEDMPLEGNLGKYRKSATFSWKHLRLVLEDPENLRIKVRANRAIFFFLFFYCKTLCHWKVLLLSQVAVWEAMKADPEFHPLECTPSVDEQKRRAARQLCRLNHLLLLPANINQVTYKTKVTALIKL